jgi:oxygen-independent coproporphyrinogen-3 oxidase
MSSANLVTSLYVHVPFCAQKCEYCAFYSEPSKGATIQRYVEALVRELEIVAPDLRPKTIFFGGGTPSLLNLKQWERILTTMDRLGLLKEKAKRLTLKAEVDYEFSIECNPATVSQDKAKLWRDYGVNRVSMGVQSLDAGLLERLGRVHSRDMVFKSFDLLRRAGFDNVNVDLMFGIPGQTLKVWRETLREALALGSEHLSSYEIIYEEDTPLFAQLQAGRFAVDEELACAMFDELLERTAAAGLEQYEIANFARRSVAVAQASSPAGSQGVLAPQSGNINIPDRACRHNVNYWRGGYFYGLGPSAAGYVRGLRTRNWSNTDLYCERLEQGKRAIESSEDLPPVRRAGEVAAFGLRMNSGWRWEDFQHATGFDLRNEWASEMQELAAREWGRLHYNGFQLTPVGLRFADSAGALFLK